MIIVYARCYRPVRQPYPDDLCRAPMPRAVASAVDLAEMTFLDLGSARRAFSLAGSGCDVEVEDDEGFAHKHVDATYGFSVSRREMEMRGVAQVEDRQLAGLVTK